jgi:hypothetical protein
MVRHTHIPSLCHPSAAGVFFFFFFILSAICHEYGASSVMWWMRFRIGATGRSSDWDIYRWMVEWYSQIRSDAAIIVYGWNEQVEDALYPGRMRCRWNRWSFYFLGGRHVTFSVAAVTRADRSRTCGELDGFFWIASSAARFVNLIGNGYHVGIFLFLCACVVSPANFFNGTPWPRVQIAIQK